MVARALGEWPERIELAYFRERDREVDFVLSTGSGSLLPVEVKCRDRAAPLDALSAFVDAHRLPLGLALTRSAPPSLDRHLSLPLPLFLLGAM